MMPAESTRHRQLRLLAFLALAGAMAFLALRSSPYLQQVPWLPSRIGLWADRHGVLRNAVGFFGFGFAALLLLGPRARLVVALCVFGTAIEVAQIWIPGRTFDWQDIVATIAGILLGWAAAGLAAALRRRRAHRG